MSFLQSASDPQDVIVCIIIKGQKFPPASQYEALGFPSTIPHIIGPAISHVDLPFMEPNDAPWLRNVARQTHAVRIAQS